MRTYRRKKITKEGQENVPSDFHFEIAPPLFEDNEKWEEEGYGPDPKNTEATSIQKVEKTSQ